MGGDVVVGKIGDKGNRILRRLGRQVAVVVSVFVLATRQYLLGKHCQKGNCWCRFERIEICNSM